MPFGKPGARSKRREELAVKIGSVRQDNRGVYGSPRGCAVLPAEGETACVNTVADLMKEREIVAKTKRKLVPGTTDSRHCRPVEENGLDRNFEADKPDLNWVVDITCIPTDQGRL